MRIVEVFEVMSPVVSDYFEVMYYRFNFIEYKVNRNTMHVLEIYDLREYEDY